MKFLIAIWSYLCIAALTSVPVQSKGWRGIVPLHSTRADVEQLLGAPTETSGEYSVTYLMQDETVIITYAKGFPCGIGERYSQWQVPRGRVERIWVTPLTEVRLSQLKIDESKYEKRSGGHRPEDIHYINDQAGESLRVFQGQVMEMNYYPAATDAHLLCPGIQSVSETKCEGLTPPVFKSYGDVALEREKLLLDNFAITLMDEQNRKGYIIAYAGKRARVGEARGRAERAKNYLVNVRRFEAERLYPIDGGYREEAIVELYVIPPGGCVPTPLPTVDPRDVQIINDKIRGNALRLSKRRCD
jgi:hypothetical protein